MTEIGQIFKTRNYGDCVVIGYENSSTVSVRFLNTGFEVVANAGNLRKGLVKDLTAKIVHGVGCLGVGTFLCRDVSGALTKEYSVWSSMLNRCYGNTDDMTQRVYADCCVEDEWLNYQNFAEWASSQPFFKKGYHLDKDILKRGNRIYSASTCTFVPTHINSAVTLEKHTNTTGYPGVWINRSGNFTAEITTNSTVQSLGTFESAKDAYTVYKAVKEAYVRSLADVYADKISKDAYDALKDWRID